jgi:hypothetical protein
MTPSRLPCRLALALAALIGASRAHAASAASTEIPRIVSENGRHALLVDGSPFLVLGGQCSNSSAWPSELPRVWDAVEKMHANTLEAPVYWEQFEPTEGHFDFALVDTLIQQARGHGVRLILLWFGTWKNGSSHYEPLWMKEHPELYPKVVGKNGLRVDTPSPHYPSTLAADTAAFRALMQHLKATDPFRTVIMVQVENESGAWDTIRDYSPAAQALFNAPVPPELLGALGLGAKKGGNWPTVFGPDADEFFHAYSVAHFVGQVAAAGKAVYPLPLYTNCALRDPHAPGPAGTYESGGPTDNVIPIWKAAAPAIDLLAPDIYQRDDAKYRRVLELYARPDNALLVPETMGSPFAAHMLFAVIGQGGIGFAPFGIDGGLEAVGFLKSHPPDEDPFAPFGQAYRLVGGAMRTVAALNYAGRLQAVAESAGTTVQTMSFGPWDAVVAYGLPRFGPNKGAPGNPEPVGGAVVASLGPDTFLVLGHQCRVDFAPSDTGSKLKREFLRVEEGVYENGAFRMTRIWNGDQTDWGLNFQAAPAALRVRLGTY